MTGIIDFKDRSSHYPGMSNFYAKAKIIKSIKKPYYNFEPLILLTGSKIEKVSYKMEPKIVFSFLTKGK